MKKHILIAFLLIFAVNAFAQDPNPENILQHNIHYWAHDQNMWGPDSSYDIDVEYTFFDVNIDETWGFEEVTEVFGQQLGVGFQAGIQALLSSTYEAHGFYTGHFDMDYPVEITLDFPNDGAFNYGGPATINTSYEVTDGWALETEFPPVGVTTLDLEYMFNPFMDFIVCVFGCDTIPIIPSGIQVPYTLDTLFHINGETGYTVYPCFEGGEFHFCHDYDLPIEFTDWFNIGMTAFVTLPYVETEDHIDPESQCLIAEGDSAYMNVHIDIIHFLHSMAGFIPPPEGPEIQQALEFLNDTIEYPIETPLGDITALIEYELLGADFDVDNYMQQDISFCPTIWANMSFPTELEYNITDPDDGDAIVEDGVQDTMSVAVGNDLNITYPCHGVAPYEDSMYVEVEYDITPTITNHTWDSVAFTITIDALTVSISIQTPFKNALEPATLPDFSLPPITNNEGEELELTASAIESKAIIPSEYADDVPKDIGPFEIGPLFHFEIPLGYAPLSWFNETWELQNLQQDTVIYDGTWIVPYDKSEVNVLLFTPIGSYCYGDPVDYIYAQAQNGLPPFDFIWSTGDIHEDINGELDSLNAEPGYYQVTMTDQYGCESYDEYSIQVNPPIEYSLSGVDILCNGEFTGEIYADVSGGTGPYDYDWSYPAAPSGFNQDTITGLPAGWHYVTITDFAGCVVYDSVFLSEPATPLTVDVDTTHVSCYGDSDGAISLDISGATPPYTIEWENGSDENTITNLTAGVYPVSVTDANGCLFDEDIIVMQPDSLIASLTATNITCNGDADGTIEIEPIGGTAPFEYQWFHDPGINSGSLENLDAGFYMLTMTDANGCTDTVSTFITQPDPLLLNTQIQHVSCFGEEDGWIQVEATGGTPPYDYNWEDGNAADSIYQLEADFYTITVIDDHDCEYIEDIEVVQPDALSLEFTDIQNITCHGLTDGSVIADVNGGTEPYTYEWGSGITHTDSLASELDAEVLYGLSITDANGCTISGEIELTEPEALIVTGTTNPVVCGENPGSATTNVEGGTAPYTYLWSNGEIIPNPVVLPTGDVWVAVTDDHGCVDSLYLFVERIGDVDAQAWAIDSIMCFNDSTATAKADIPAGFPPLSFLWTTHSSDLTFEGDSVWGLPAGRYTIYASDLYNCSDTVPLHITQPDSINPNFIITEPSCSSVYDGSVECETSGGTPPYNYIWSTGDMDEGIEDICEGWYYLTITDAHNCFFNYELHLTESKFCLIVYNTITPNGDGKNDQWIIENIEEFPQSEVWIFNRDGNHIFYAKAYQNDWEGTYNNKPLPESTYYYIIDPGDGTNVLKGHLTIIR